MMGVSKSADWKEEGGSGNRATGACTTYTGQVKECGVECVVFCFLLLGP